MPVVHYSTLPQIQWLCRFVQSLSDIFFDNFSQTEKNAVSYWLNVSILAEKGAWHNDCSYKSEF